jgi:hypothetical protein
LIPIANRMASAAPRHAPPGRFAVSSSMSAWSVRTEMTWSERVAGSEPDNRLRALPPPAPSDQIVLGIATRSRVHLLVGRGRKHPVASSQLETHTPASPRRGLVGGQGGTVPGPGGASG